MKIAVIGSGSTYTPELLEGVIEHVDDLDVSEVALMDIDEERNSVVGGLAQRMVEKAGSPFKVTLTDSLSDAVDGAGFVLTQLRVGGQQARHIDTRVCLEEGVVGQETTGAAGFAKAMRTIPVVLDVCAAMRRSAPDAWLINFTNPAGIVTEAVLKHGGVKAMGLCNSPFGMQRHYAERFNARHEDVDLDYVGLNHLSWVRRVFVSGRDVTDEVFPVTPRASANIPELALGPELLAALHMQPNGYLRYFYLEDEMVRELKAKPQTRAEEVMEIEKTLLEKYRDPDLGEKPEELSRRGGAYYSTVAVSLIRSIVGHTGLRHIVNVQNNGATPHLDDDAVIEVTAAIDGRGAHPLHVGAIEPEIRGLIQHVKAYESLTVEAAVQSSYNKALLALVNNPLVNSAHKAKRLLDRFIELHEWELA